MNPEDVIGGKYRLDSVVAEGGMAVVWRATDMHLRREVAVKMLKPSIADDEVQAERFRREAIALAQLHHPHIMPVYDCINEDGRVALVMQLINGQSLRDLLDKDRAANGGKASTLSVHTTVHIGRAIASALGAVHAEGIVHRDIKPGNIMMMRSGEIWLTDFGIAKGVKSDQDDNTDLTRPDLMMGTAKYLSPEQVQGRELDGRADIYSLGLVLYECLAGHAPFKGENEQQVAIARLQRDPTPLAGIRHDVPSTVIDVIHKMLRRKPENRYQSADEVVTALAEAMRTVHDSVTPPDGLNGPERQRTKRNDPLDPLMKRRVEEARRRAEAGNAGGDTTPGNGVSATAADDTPTSTKKTRSAALPKRQRTRTARNMIPVVTVFVIAAVMAMLLWNGLRDTRSSVPAGTDPGQAPIAAVALNGVRSYDPNGDDGNENEAQVPWLLDGNPATAWTTVCYGDRYFGSKGGLGLVLELSGSGIGTITASFGNGPWNAEVYVSDAPELPARIEDWGLRVADAYGESPGTGTFAVKTPGRRMLLLLREIGRSNTCSNTNPYKGVINDLGFSSAP
ncbi:MAG: serine/threonine protein kinase [Actinomycetota bacterium]